MAKLSQLTIPVKNPSSGVVTSQTFNLAGSGGGGSDTNFIGTKAEYDALPSSEKENYDSMDFTDYHDGLNIDPTPMINSKNPVASGGVYAALQNVNSEIENLEEGVTNATELVAPLEQALVATRNYSVGDQFVYNGFLYKATAAIPFDSAIVIGTNCELAPNVVEQIRALSNSQIQIMTKEVSGTTNSYGDISLGLSNAYCVLACGIKSDSGGVFAIPRLISAGNWYATCYSINAKMQSKSVAVTVYYCSI